MESYLNILAKQLGNLLLQKNLRLVTAESCTGGGLSFHLTNIPGSSHWFERGFVAYSNQAKIEALGVSEKAIEAHGSVSKEIAENMATGAVKHSAANVSISITGIAGPDGGSDEKPVGTVWFGFAGSVFKHPQTFHHHFFGGREHVRGQAIQFAMGKLIELLNAN